jgi:hypothetical protein
MSLIRGRINPMNALGLRKLNHVPPHFGQMFIKSSHDMYAIDNWIYTNLDSRYCIKKNFKISNANKLEEVIEIGIEDPKELSMLSLGCPYLK